MYLSLFCQNKILDTQDKILDTDRRDASYAPSSVPARRRRQRRLLGGIKYFDIWYKIFACKKKATAWTFGRFGFLCNHFSLINNCDKYGCMMLHRHVMTHTHTHTHTHTCTHTRVCMCVCACSNFLFLPLFTRTDLLFELAFSFCLAIFSNFAILISNLVFSFCHPNF